MGFTDNITSAFEQLENSLNGQKESFPSNLRREALSSFQKLGIPGRKHEEWKYTNIKTQLPESLSISQNTVTPGKAFNSFENIRASKLVFVNGTFNNKLSNIIAETGVIAGSLKEHFVASKELTENHYGKLVNKYQEHFSVLNTAFATDGGFVHIKKDVVSEIPVFIICLYDSPENFTQSRNLIIAEEGSSIKIVVDFQNIGTSSFYNHVSEVFVGKSANVNITKLQTATTNSTAVHTLETDVERDGRFICNTVTLEGNLIRNSTNVRLSGENTDAHLNGLYYGRGNSLIDNHILIDHMVANCESRQLYKGILDEESTGVFNGKIFVKPDAQKTNAFQSSKAILLSDDASVYSKPQLEIFADDVKCSHGAAIGQLNENEVFYLRTRGIYEKDAKAMLTYAFASDVIETIAVEELKQYLDELLKARLGLDF